MDSNEVELLTELGGWLLDNFAPLPLILFLYALSAPFLFVDYKNNRRRPRTTPAWLVFIVTVVGLLLASIHIASAIADYVKLIRSYLITYVQLPPDEQEDLGDRGQFVTSILGQWTTDLMLMSSSPY
ncbi:hypothetical protein H0H92_007546 [Tricholoma furcatifolium]|nr:hypothetical protein H0H92_007546 [Tricholoma furcatifolium]